MNTTQPQTTNEKQYLHQVTPGALLPLYQTLITAIIVFASVYVVAWVVFDSLDPHKPATILAVMSMLVMWLTRMRMWGSLVTHIENATGLDINNDNRIGDGEEDEERRISRVRIELSRVIDGHYSVASFDLPKGVTEEHLAQIAHDMFILGKTYAETELSGPGRISLPKFRQLRLVMERQGLCEKIGTASNAPFELTDQGEAWLKQYLPSPPPPREGA